MPAVTAVLDGVARVGVAEHEHARILGPARKAAERDVPVAIAQRWDLGATTVSASVALAAAAGVSVFATGGIGGVHRGSELTGDVSADLDAIAHHPVVTVCAGAKAFLDLPRTLELPGDGRGAGARVAPRLVPGVLHPVVRRCRSRTGSSRRPRSPRVLANRSRRDGRRAARRCRSPSPTSSIAAELDAVLVRRLADADAAGITGAAVTPFVLGRIAEATAGRSVPANLALAENNAAVAAEVAVAVAAS